MPACECACACECTCVHVHTHTCMCTATVVSGTSTIIAFTRWLRYLHLWHARVTLTDNMLHFHCIITFAPSPTLPVPQSPILIASPTDRTSHSITVGWTNDQANQLPMRHVVVNVARDGNEVGRVRADADERKVSVFGLLADTEYLVTVWAENSIGQSSNHSLLVKTRQAGMFCV